MSAACLVLGEPDQAFRQSRPRSAGSFSVPVMVGIERHAVFVRSWFLARTSRAVFCAWQLLHIGWRFARSKNSRRSPRCGLM